MLGLNIGLALNKMEFAEENDVILNKPCKKSVKSDMGKPSDKKEALTIDVQKKFFEVAEGQSYEDQLRFVLQTGLRTGELVGLKWEDIDFVNKTIKISRTMEYRYLVGEWRVGPPKTLQKILGHSNIGITMNLYVHMTEDEKKREIDLVASALNVV